MPNYATKRERELYMLGYMDGQDGVKPMQFDTDPRRGGRVVDVFSSRTDFPSKAKIPRRKLSAWNKFVKANSKKKIFQYANGKLKLKKLTIAFRKKKR